MATKSDLITALKCLPKNDQLIVSFLRANRISIADFESICSVKADRKELIAAGLALRVATWEQTKKSGTFVMIDRCPYAMIKGRK